MTCGDDWIESYFPHSLPGRGRWDASFHHIIGEEDFSGTIRINMYTEEFRRHGELTSTHALKTGVKRSYGDRKEVNRHQLEVYIWYGVFRQYELGKKFNPFPTSPLFPVSNQT